MVEIGGRLVLWHIMHIYAAHGFTEFLVACGYKGETIKEYFQQIAWKDRNCNDSTSALALRQPDLAWVRRMRICRETANLRRLDQRRLFLFSSRFSVTSKATIPCLRKIFGTVNAGKRTDGVSPRLILAAYGHVAGAAFARSTVGQRAGTLEIVGVSA
jgi:hypothetical protein